MGHRRACITWAMPLAENKEKPLGANLGACVGVVILVTPYQESLYVAIAAWNSTGSTTAYQTESLVI